MDSKDIQYVANVQKSLETLANASDAALADLVYLKGLGEDSLEYLESIATMAAKFINA